jgi:hypothetical protein
MDAYQKCIFLAMAVNLAGMKRFIAWLKSVGSMWAWRLSLICAGALLTTPGQAEVEGLTPDQRQRLERDGFCIGERPDLGMAGPYLGRESPVFITTDSVLALFHGLVRKTIVQRDAALANTLAAGLRRNVANLEAMNPDETGADPVVCKAAMTRAKIVCGTALRLLDPAWHAADPAIAREIDAEAARVETAAERVKPAWLGAPESVFRGLDYTSCKPVGLHEEKPAEQRYFRAVRFLQMIPFRLARKEELYAACYILRASQVPNQPGLFDQVFEFNSVIGCPAIFYTGMALDQRPAATPLLGGMLGNDLKYDRDAPFGPAPTTLINNLIADAPMPIKECDSRMISPLFLPDALLFQQVTDRLTVLQRADELPDPLLAAAWFGDHQAQTRMQGKYPGCPDLFVVKRPPPVRLPFRPEPALPPLFEAYDDVLRTLMKGPEKGAPEFMRKGAWHLKTRQTVLASWARMRNCFALEAPGGIGIGGGPEDRPGFVEPCPEFYQKLGSLAATMKGAILVSEAAEAPNTRATSPPDAPGFIARADLRWKEPPITGAAWSSFALLCSRLEAMAHKQLRGIEWNDLDRKFFGEYGFRLLNRCDDLPRAAAVARTAQSGKTLIAASGLPRSIWVSYPWKGKAHLCEGAVMTFYSSTAAGPVTDAEWGVTLRANPPPAAPDWLAPLAMPDLSPGTAE